MRFLNTLKKKIVAIIGLFMVLVLVVVVLVCSQPPDIFDLDEKDYEDDPFLKNYVHALKNGKMNEGNRLFPPHHLYTYEGLDVIRAMSNTKSSKFSQFLEYLIDLCLFKDRRYWRTLANDTYYRDEYAGIRITASYILADICREDANLKKVTEPDEAITLVLQRRMGEKAIDTLLSMIDHEDHNVSMHVLGHLGEYGNKRVVDHLLANLNCAKDGEVFMYYAENLGRLKDKRAFLPLVELLKDDNAHVRFSACQGLGELGDKRAGDHIVEMLKLEDETRQVYAYFVLADLEDKRAIEPLKKIFNDKSDKFSLRHRAGLELGRLGDKTSFDYLIELLSKQSSRACVILGDLGDERAIPHIKKSVKELSSEDYYWITAEEALRKLKKEE